VLVLWGERLWENEWSDERNEQDQIAAGDNQPSDRLSRFEPTHESTLRFDGVADWGSVWVAVLHT
jgi:hypothetical protein